MRRILLFFALLAAVFVFFFGCQTAQSPIKKINPFTLMDSHELYVYFPVKGNEQLAGRFMTQFFGALPEHTVNQIISRIHILYGGFGPDSKPAELAVAGSFSRTVLKSAFTQKNGWAAVQKNVLRHETTDIEIYTGTPGLLFIARDVKTMLARQDSKLPPDVPQWMAETVSGSDIAFFLPQALTVLPDSLRLALAILPILNGASASGILKKNGQNEGYVLSLDVNIHNERLASVAAPLLAKTISPLAIAEVTAGDGGHILISGIHLDTETITGLIRFE
ncbi:MAG: hypothetical protein LBS97_06615 [Treponema sp.]|jgi:hypothetical protein|nr:hypothetical protein [Treponema sp.]